MSLRGIRLWLQGKIWRFARFLAREQGRACVSLRGIRLWLQGKIWRFARFLVRKQGRACVSLRGIRLWLQGKIWRFARFLASEQEQDCAFLLAFGFGYRGKFGDLPAFWHANRGGLLRSPSDFGGIEPPKSRGALNCEMGKKAKSSAPPPRARTV